MEYNSQHALTARKWSWKLEFLAGVLEYTCYKIYCAATSILPWDKKLQKVILKDPCAKRLRATLTLFYCPSWATSSKPKWRDFHIKAAYTGTS